MIGLMPIGFSALYRKRVEIIDIKTERERERDGVKTGDTPNARENLRKTNKYK